jgi:hypothetical protein
MARISATWKRSVRVREYETETLELFVERDFMDVPSENLVAAAVNMDRDLAHAGDALVAERLEARIGSDVQSPPRGVDFSKRLKAGKPAGPSDPDPLLS